MVELELGGFREQVRPAVVDSVFHSTVCSVSHPTPRQQRVQRIPNRASREGVAVVFQGEAWETIPRMLQELDLGRTEKCVRVNSVSSGLAEADLEALLQAPLLPPALMLPKVEDAGEVRWVSDSVRVLCVSFV